MSEGATIALVFGGVAVVGGLAYLALGPGSTAPGVQPLYADNPQLAFASPTAPGTAPSNQTAVGGLVSGFNSLNQAGCQLAASKIGAGNLGAIGCSEFLKYATPIGIAQVANKVLTKIPGVATAEHAVATVVSKPISVVKNILGSIF